jgi:hypothetical protein
MIKKYVMIIVVLMVMLMLTSTSTASFSSRRGEIYEMLQEKFQTNLLIKNIFERFSQVISNNDGDSMSIDTYDDEEEDDGEYDDEIDSDGPKEDELLPKIWDMVGEKTPDDGDELVDDSEETTTIDSDGEVGATQGGWTVDSDGGDGAASNEITTDEDEWTVDHDGEGGTLERFVEIVTERNVKLGAMLQRVIECTVATDENGISSSGSSGSAENNIVDVDVVTDGDQ